MNKDKRLVHLYNEEEHKIIQFIEYKRLQVQGRSYVLLQPEDDMEQLVPFRIETVNDEDGEEEIFVYVVEQQELDALEAAWNRLHS